MVKELIERLEAWGIKEEDVKIDYFNQCIMENCCFDGVSVELKKHGLIVNSISEKTQMGNIKKCFETIESILMNIGHNALFSIKE